MRILEHGTYRNLEYSLYVDEEGRHVLEVINRVNGSKDIVVLKSSMNLPFIKEIHFDRNVDDYIFIIEDARGIGDNLKIVISE